MRLFCKHDLKGQLSYRVNWMLNYPQFQDKNKSLQNSAHIATIIHECVALKGDKPHRNSFCPIEEDLQLLAHVDVYL